MLIAWHRPIWPIFMAFNLEAHFYPMLARDPLGEVALSIQNHQKCSTENVKRILRQPHHDQQRGTPITQTIIIQIIWTQVDRGVWEVWTSYTSEFFIYNKVFPCQSCLSFISKFLSALGSKSSKASLRNTAAKTRPHNQVPFHISCFLKLNLLSTICKICL